ncbi:MAG TPA: class A beta-lactamase [Sphingomicrobium sp.]
MPRLKALALALPLAAAVAAAPLSAEPPAEVAQAEIARLALPAKGVVGVAAWRLDGKGPVISINAGQSFPMASTFKVAVAGAIFAKVDRGELSLDRMVEIDPERHVVSEVIADRFIHPGVSLSVHNLIELMLTQSDNSATDVLADLAGGPEAVTAWVRAQGIEGLRVDRDTAGILRDFFGLPAGPFPAAFEQALKAEPDIEAKASRINPRFDDDLRDTTTPKAMASLLDRLFNGRLLSPASTRLMIAAMERNRTGNGRIRARLPRGTLVADKTGTIGGSLNDVGVITLPGAAGRVVLAVFIKKSSVPFEAREEVIADIARSIYDFYLFEGSR